MSAKALRRRLFAALLLFSFAVGAVFFWEPDRPFQLQLPLIAINLLFACGGLVILHLRWRRQEGTHVDPKQAEDIFS